MQEPVSSFQKDNIDIFEKNSILPNSIEGTFFKLREMLNLLSLKIGLKYKQGDFDKALNTDIFL